MKILIVSPYMPAPIKNGLNLTLYTAIKSFISKHDCDFIGLYQSQEEIDCTHNEFSELKIIDLYKSVRSNFNRLKALITFRSPAILSNYNSKIKKSIKNALKQGNYDVVFYFSINAYKYYVRNKYAKNILSVSDALSRAYYDRYKFANGFNKLYNLYNYNRINHVEKINYRKFDTIHVVSPIDKNVLMKKNGSNNIKVVPIVVFDEFFVNRKVHNGINIFYCDNAAAPNSLSGVMEFINELNSEDIQNSIHITLKFSQNDEALEKKIKDSMNITHIKYIDNFAETLLESDIVIAFDTIGSGLKNRVLQAMAAGCCVVGTPVALEGFKIKIGEHVYSGQNPREIADIVKNLIQNPDEIVRIGNNAREIAKQYYTFEIVKNEWLRLIDETVNGNSK